MEWEWNRWTIKYNKWAFSWNSFDKVSNAENKTKNDAIETETKKYCNKKALNRPMILFTNERKKNWFKLMKKWFSLKLKKFKPIIITSTVHHIEIKRWQCMCDFILYFIEFFGLYHLGNPLNIMKSRIVLEKYKSLKTPGVKVELS